MKTTTHDPLPRFFLDFFLGLFSFHFNDLDAISFSRSRKKEVSSTNHFPIWNRRETKTKTKKRITQKKKIGNWQHFFGEMSCTVFVKTAVTIACRGEDWIPSQPQQPLPSRNKNTRWSDLKEKTRGNRRWRQRISKSIKFPDAPSSFVYNKKKRQIKKRN